MNSLKVTNTTDIKIQNNTKDNNTKTTPAYNGFKTPPSNFLTSPLGSPSQVKAPRPGNIRRALPISPTVGKRGFRNRNNLVDSQRAAHSLPIHDSLYLRLLAETRRQRENPRGILKIPETQDDGAQEIISPTLM
ncbi:uncharacterized protein EAE97_002232 [Botrytis byssoidea]|uniref:Uncharacterized protein n=1 Tax=Botrytis byssoidea TaxID=139641 RepID=A0A9P5IQQ8_9HELO|nr:uncharacterized protein EAE97_002232 [Botrytis byssoidea]KAF7950680.1 hypothetical protein EAE97_002232 [Botrytis byssoidea]